MPRSPPGAWQELTFAVNETAKTMQAWLGGQVRGFNTSGGTVSQQHLGGMPIIEVQLVTTQSSTPSPPTSTI